MGGLVAGRLFNLLPPVMLLQAKYEPITNLWNHIGPSSKKNLRIGLDVQVPQVLDVLHQHIDEVGRLPRQARPFEPRQKSGEIPCC
jgi:hypothetical protein